MIPIPRFESLPWLMRQAAVASLGWRNRVRRFSDEYRRWGEFLIVSNNWDVAHREDWQRRQLLALIESAQTGTVYYKERLTRVGELVPLEDFRELLQSIPVLKKQTLKNRQNEFRNIHVKETSVTSTSGSTGSPMKVGHDAQSIQRGMAFLSDHLRLVGIRIRDPSVRLSGRILCEAGKPQRKPWLYNPAERQLFLSSYHLDSAHSSVIATQLTSMAPVLIDGYPSGILDVLRILKKEGCKLDSLKAIITTAETLHPEMRRELTERAGVPVMDYYSASEGVPLIQQCQFGTYHVRWQSGIFEVDNGKSIGLEGDGELVCTSFIQDRTPLIRYRTGDLVRGLIQLPQAVCRCGLITATVENILGRVEDLIRTHDGRTLGMFTYRTLKNIEGLKETQVIQHGFDDFEVYGIVDKHADASKLQEEIRESFQRVLGYSIKLHFTPVDQIPRGSNGKVRLVICKVPKQ